MITFRFRAEDIRHYYPDFAAWHTFVRTQEANMIFSVPSVAGRRFRAGLELGAGNGLQSAVIIDHCDDLICTDLVSDSYAEVGKSLLERHHERISFQKCNAEDLSNFADGQFDLVYSSNVLEHISNLSTALQEIRRVLSNDGLALHAMPSRHWKIFNTVFFLVGRRWPPVHGVSVSHLQEFIRFGKNWWADTFRRHGFEILEIARMPFYIGVRKGQRTVVLGNRLGLTSSHMFVIQKAKC